MTRRIRILAAIIVLATIVLAGGPGNRLRPSALAADPPPANDNFASAQEISPYDSPASPPMTFDEMTTGATLEAGESAPCALTGATVWYLYQPAHDQTVEIGTAGSSFDTVLAVYTMDAWYPSPPSGSLHAVACNEGTPSTVTLAAKGRARYYIQVGGKDGATGALHLDARCVPGCRPADDDFRDATWAYVDARSPRTTFTETTKFATLEPGEPQPCGNIGATVWYQVIPSPGTSDITIDTAGSDFDTVLAVYGLPSAIYPSPPGTLAATQCNATGRQSRLTVYRASYTPIYVQVGGAGGATGSLVLNIACDPACQPQNDDLAGVTDNGVPISDVIHTEGATTELGEPAPCGKIGRTVWYMVHLPANATVAVDTSGSNFDTVVAAYSVTSGPAGYVPASNVACSAGNAGERARIEFSAFAGQPYLIQAGGRDGASGELDISITCVPAACPPPGDSMADAQLLGGDTILEIDTSGATVEPGETLNCGIVGATVWFHVQAAPTLRIRLSAADSDYPVAFAAYRWTTLSPPGGVTFAGCGDPVQPSTIELGPDPVFLEYLVQSAVRAAKAARCDCVPSASAAGRAHTATNRQRPTRRPIPSPTCRGPCRDRSDFPTPGAAATFRARADGDGTTTAGR